MADTGLLIQFQMKAPVKLICYGCLKFATIIKYQHENPSLKNFAAANMGPYFRGTTFPVGL